jgi:hypothetical protein
MSEAVLQGRYACHGWRAQVDIFVGPTKFRHLSLQVVHRRGKFLWSCCSLGMSGGGRETALLFSLG